jgi:hypothetical protein
LAVRLGLIAVLLALAAAGCAFHPDPTEDNFYVKIVNDTPRTVTLATCGTGDYTCTKTYQTGALAPGKAWPSVQTSVGSANPVLVSTTAGRRLGCLPLLFDHNADGAVVRVSTAAPCRPVK